jgi:hypothetical protein
MRAVCRMGATHLPDFVTIIISASFIDGLHPSYDLLLKTPSEGEGVNSFSPGAVRRFAEGGDEGAFQGTHTSTLTSTCSGAKRY